MKNKQTGYNQYNIAVTFVAVCSVFYREWLNKRKMASETFFSQANTNFPDPSDVGEIDLNGFLLASSHLAKFFGTYLLNQNRKSSLITVT